MVVYRRVKVKSVDCSGTFYPTGPKFFSDGRSYSRVRTGVGVRTTGCRIRSEFAVSTSPLGGVPLTRISQNRRRSREKARTSLARS